jgi:Fe-Mn family superoxide dismutase
MASIDRRTFMASAASGIAGAAALTSSTAGGQTPGGAPNPVAGQTPAPAPEKFTPIGLDSLKGGIEGFLSAALLEQHAKLYQGYVTRTNALVEKTMKMVASGTHLNDQKAPTAEYAELKRRFGFEFDGMVLHEYYFQNIKKGSGDIPQGSALAKAATASFGSVQTWWQDFMATAKLPGVGWVICCQDPASKRLFNTWVSMHQDGNVSGYHVILALDVWEHAYMPDYLATERGKYLSAFEKCVDWEAGARRLVV